MDRRSPPRRSGRVPCFYCAHNVGPTRRALLGGEKFVFMYRMSAAPSLIISQRRRNVEWSLQGNAMLCSVALVGSVCFAFQEVEISAAR
jgi:hypothetical protein